MNYRRCSITLSQDSPINVGPEMFATHFASREGFDLNAPFRRNLPHSVPPLTDRLGRHAKSAGKVVDVAETTHRDFDTGIQFVGHEANDKVILSRRQALPATIIAAHDLSDMAKSTADDSATLAAKLRAAFAACGESEIDVKNAIARELGISRQAIDGWLRTGRIGKLRIVVVARHTGQSLDYFLGQADMTAQEQEEVKLVQQYRALPDELKSKLLQDAETYVRPAPPPKKPKKH